MKMRPPISDPSRVSEEWGHVDRDPLSKLAKYDPIID
jgi:hypothetical protein